MGRNRPKLLHHKLLAIREYLEVQKVDMASMLHDQLLSHSDKEYQFKGGRITEWESGRREPDMLVVLAYSRLGHVSIDLMIDDAIGVSAFREMLGKQLLLGKTTQHQNKKVKKSLKK